MSEIIKQLKKEIRAEKLNLKKNQVYQDVKRKLALNSRELSKLHTERDRITRKIRSKFLEVYHSRSNYPYPSGTNILPHILDIIKEKTGGSLSNLKSSQIEDVVRKMIDRAKSEHKRLRQVEGQIDELDLLIAKLYKKEEELEHDMRVLDNKLRSEEQKTRVQEESEKHKERDASREKLEKNFEDIYSEAKRYL